GRPAALAGGDARALAPPAADKGDPLAVGRPGGLGVDPLAGGEQGHRPAGARAGPDLSLVGKGDGAPVGRQARLDRPEGPGQLRRLLGRPVPARPDQHAKEQEPGRGCGDQSAVHGDVLRQGSHASDPPRTAHSLSRSMLPPDTTHTTLPPPAPPASAHATGQAPAPSAMTWLRSASRRTAAATSARPATRAPSISPRARSSICGKTVRLPMPSTNDGW